jgi:translation initiation factor IF-2
MKNQNTTVLILFIYVVSLAIIVMVNKATMADLHRQIEDQIQQIKKLNNSKSKIKLLECKEQNSNLLLKLENFDMDLKKCDDLQDQNFKLSTEIIELQSECGI